MKSVTTGEYDNEIKEGVVLVDFYADWCGPCKMIAPILEQIAEEYKDRLKIIKVNVDFELEIAERYGIMSIPTLILFNNGEIIKKVSGFQNKASLINLLKTVIV